MSILKKTRADLSVSLYFYTPLINLNDIVLGLYLYDTWGGSDLFFDIMDSHKNEFDNYKVVNGIIREFYVSQKNGEEKVLQKVEDTPAQKVKAFIEEEKVYNRLRCKGVDGETIIKIQAVQKKFQGRFVT